MKLSEKTTKAIVTLSILLILAIGLLVVQKNNQSKVEVVPSTDSTMIVVDTTISIDSIKTVNDSLVTPVN